MTDRAGRPVRVAAVNDYDLIVEGMAGLLSRYPDRVHVCDPILVGEPIDGDWVDVALYDSYGRAGAAAPVLATLSSRPEIGHVALFSLDLRAELVAAAREAGATGFVSKALPRAALTNREIAAALYVGVETVKSHLTNVYRRLGVRNRIQAATDVERAESFRRRDPVPARVRPGG